MNVQMSYSQWLDISRGIVGARSWDKLHASEIFVALGFGVLLWLAAGREIVTLDFATLQIRKEILGIGWSRKYALADVRTIGASSFLYPRAAGKWDANNVRAELYFDHMGKIKNFGRELRLEDAVRIEKAIQSFGHSALNRYDTTTNVD